MKDKSEAWKYQLERHSLEVRTITSSSNKKGSWNLGVAAGIHIKKSSSFSQLSASSSLKMGKVDCVHLLLGKAWGASSIISQRFPEKLHIKVSLLNWRCWEGAVVRMVSPPRGPPCLSPWRHCGFQCAFHSLGCLSKQPSLFPLWALLLLEPSPSSGNMCLRLPFGSLAPHLERLSAFAFSPSRHFPAFGGWKAVLNTLSSKSWFLILLAHWEDRPKIHTQIQKPGY